MSNFSEISNRRHQAETELDNEELIRKCLSDIDDLLYFIDQKIVDIEHKISNIKEGFLSTEHNPRKRAEKGGEDVKASKRGYRPGQSPQRQGPQTKR